MTEIELIWNCFIYILVFTRVHVSLLMNVLLDCRLSMYNSGSYGSSGGSFYSYDGYRSHSRARPVWSWKPWQHVFYELGYSG
jgi:hypothetical protein